MGTQERVAELPKTIVWFAAAQTMALLFALHDDRMIEIMRGWQGCSIAVAVVAFNLGVYFPVMRWSRESIDALLEDAGAGDVERRAQRELARRHERLVWVFLVLSVITLLAIAFDIPSRPPPSTQAQPVPASGTP